VSGTLASNGEGRRLIQQGAVKLNGEKVGSADLEIPPVGEFVLQAGKRKFVKIVFVENK
jgi:tyrosyl-tRNA synthetase